jgi:hypothetical protein
LATLVIQPSIAHFLHFPMVYASFVNSGCCLVKRRVFGPEVQWQLSLLVFDIEIFILELG